MTNTDFDMRVMPVSDVDCVAPRVLNPINCLSYYMRSFRLCLDRQQQKQDQQCFHRAGKMIQMMMTECGPSVSSVKIMGLRFNLQCVSQTLLIVTT